MCVALRPGLDICVYMLSASWKLPGRFESISAKTSSNVLFTPNLPTNVVPTNIARLKLSGKSPMGLGIPPLKINIMLESKPLKSTMLVGRLGVLFPSFVVLGRPARILRTLPVLTLWNS